MRRLIPFLIFYTGLIVCSNASQVIRYMTDCERSVHTACVINIGSSKEFTEDCEPEKLIACLNRYVEDSVCKVGDRDTIPTIQNLVTLVSKKFRKDPMFCKKRKRFEHFVKEMQDHFTVQGFGVEYTESRSYEYSGSGDAVAPDDNENGDDDDDAAVVGENINGRTTSSRKENNHKNDENDNDEVSNNVNSVTKDSTFWKKQSLRIQKDKNDRKVQLLVYFDDASQYKRKQREQERRKNRVPSAENNAWEELKRSYQRWYKASRFFKGT